MYLHQLAQRAAAMPGDWKPETAGLAWRTMLLAEQVHSRPEAMAWVRRRSTTPTPASTRRGCSCCRPRPPATRRGTSIAEAWNDAATKYQDVDAQQRAIRDGRASLSRALAALVSLIPYLEASPKPELQTDWMDAADRCGELARMLEPPADQQPGPPGAFTAMTEAATGLDRLTRKLMAPFQPAAVKAIVESVRLRGRAGPGARLADRCHAPDPVPRRRRPPRPLRRRPRPRRPPGEDVAPGRSRRLARRRPGRPARRARAAAVQPHGQVPHDGRRREDSAMRSTNSARPSSGPAGST